MNFTKENLVKSGEYLMYRPEGSMGYADQEFIARFKYQRGALGTFKTFLIKNFTVEEYFALAATVNQTSSDILGFKVTLSPLEIVERKGYILPHIRKWAAQGDKAGIDYIARVAARNAARVAA